ncbi:MAG TPA: AAA family ATPase [Trinickia sp.]|jgi:exodeoxyribonuclease V alpha subunit|uniref:AAA family ATPase n=1 Tax=Trinickia sp. TaxID=2571163 RepID=UPI002BE7247C|nr:AAA family ATPase [Trinickia sp.]HVW51668.1 AAA family ATPase [Trinickia sp.]
MSSTAQSFRPAPQREGGEFGAALAAGFAYRMGALAGRVGANPAAARWARRAAFAVSRATSAGHVCLSLERLARRYGETLDEAAAALRASGIVSDGTQDAAALRPLVLDAAGRLYLGRYYEDERRLAAAVIAHAPALGARDAGAAVADIAGASARDTDESGLAARLTRFFGPPDSSDVDWQRACAALSLSSRLTVVSGGPGTGKTTTVVGMLACLIDADPSLTIALAAPTGKAAQRMQEALLARAASLPASIAERLPRVSQTLHRLLGLSQGMRARYGRDNPLPYDVLVVDEASMIDLTLAAQLFDALAPHTRLVLLGDKDQLAAVEAGAVFAELSARPSFSAAGIARIARATDVDEARVRAALPRWQSDEDAARDADRSEVDAFSSDDGLDLLEPLGSLEDGWGWTGLEEPDIAIGGEGAGADAAADANPGAPPDWPQGEVPGAASERTMAAAQSASHTAPVAAFSERAPLVDCVVWLERNYRFGLDSAIGRLSVAIRRGDVQAAFDALGVTRNASPQSDLFAQSDALGEHGTAPAQLDEDNGPVLRASTLQRLAQGFAPYVEALTAALAAPRPDCASLFDALNAFRILCATRLGPRGVQALNAQMAEHVRRAARVPLAIGSSWFAGRAVMVARNDYALGLFNGDIGIALPTPEGPLRVFFRTADGSVRGVAPAALPPHDTAFALTVHKSQGSEFDHAALVLPASTSRVLTRELVYTAVTRARKTVRVVGAREVLAEAIAAPTRRDSGLLARMQEMQT